VDSRALRWFQLVCDGTTLTELSDIERMSQPAISRALARLEEEVGAPLLRRSGRVLRMTAAGAAFKQHVDEMLHRLDDGIAAASQAVDPERGTVHLGFQPALATWLVPALIRSFRDDHPHVTFVLTEVRGAAAPEALETGSVDLLIGTRRLSTRRAQRLRLMDQPLALAVPPDHPQAGRASISMRETADETYLMLREASSLGALTRDLCRGAGFEPRVAFESDDLSTLRGFVAAGLGVAVLPLTGSGVLDGMTAPLRYIPIEEHTATQEIALTWSAEHPLLPAADLFRSHIARLVSTRALPGVLAGPAAEAHSEVPEK